MGRGKGRKKRRSRKRKGKKRNTLDRVDINIIHSNIDGYTSKKESVDSMANNMLPDVITLNETLLTGKHTIKQKNYMSFCKNRDDLKEGGGVATLIAEYLRPDTVKVSEGKDGDEYVITRLEHVIPAVNVINVYGNIESRAGGKDNILERWMRLMKKVKAIKERGEGILIIGDMNRHIGCGQYGVAGNNYKGLSWRQADKRVIANRRVCVAKRTESG